jgi:putative intracellular protease/amidase/ribosomal protein S18 acetylase RimI-like enzyme
VEEGVEKTTVRRAGSDYAGSIHKVHNHAFRGLRGRDYEPRAIEAAVTSLDEINRRITRGEHILVAESDGKIVGTATGLEEHETLHVCSVAVNPAWQERGIAQMLMEILEEIAQRQRCHKLWLQTAWVMTEATALYERMGFQQEGYMPCQFYGEDFLVFGKVLKKKVEQAKDASRLRGAILIFPGVEELGFVGIYEVLTKARSMGEDGELALDVPPEALLLAREQRVVCANGLVVQPHRRYVGFMDFDFVVIPGGPGVDSLRDDSLLMDLSCIHKAGKILGSVCTGAMVLAWSGVLQGRRAMTQHASKGRLREYCDVVDQRVVIDENIMTSAGVSASLDLGLAVIERFYGENAARKVAQRIEYSWE